MGILQINPLCCDLAWPIFSGGWFRVSLRLHKLANDPEEETIPSGGKITSCTMYPKFQLQALVPQYAGTFSVTEVYAFLSLFVYFL